MAFSVNEFKSRLKFGGARSTLFEISITPPSGIPGVGPGLSEVRFMARAGALPASNLGLIGVPYFGRTVKLAGDRTFAPWTVTIINDEDFKVRNALETWSNSINNMRGNLRLSGASPLSYKSTAVITQYGKTGNVLRTYKFEGLYPGDISDIGLNWADTDQIEEFQCTFEYDYWVLDAAGSKATGDIGKQG